MRLEELTQPWAMRHTMRFWPKKGEPGDPGLPHSRFVTEKHKRLLQYYMKQGGKVGSENSRDAA